MNARSRAEAHRRHKAELHARKRLRRQRNKIILAIEEAKRLKRSKRRGCTNYDRNLFNLGYEQVKDTGPIEERYRAVDQAHEFLLPEDQIAA